MRFDPSPAQRALLAEIDELLDAAPAGASARELFALLGARRLLAVHYPERFGGRGLPPADQAVVAEHLGVRGLPDEVHLVTVQGVGCTILAHGDEQQRERRLPPIAAGRACASLLLSEEQAGTDIAGIDTVASATAGGYVLDGRKAWNLRADWSSFGLCSARTRAGAGRYDGISLFIVDFDSPGVRVEPVDRATGEPYFTVHLDGVRVDAADRVGPEHEAWHLLVRAIGFERAGFDYLSRARRWLRAAERIVESRPPAERAALRPALLQHERAVATARALAYHAVGGGDGLEMDEAASAYSKLACGEAAQSLARWAGLELAGCADDPAFAEEAAMLRDACAEAPELSISGGAVELQLDLIATEQRMSGSVR